MTASKPGSKDPDVGLGLDAGVGVGVVRGVAAGLGSGVNVGVASDEAVGVRDDVPFISGVPVGDAVGVGVAVDDVPPLPPPPLLLPELDVAFTITTVVLDAPVFSAAVMVAVTLSSAKNRTLASPLSFVKVV